MLSIATLNIATSRVRPAICSLVRIDQTCFGRSGGLAPTNLPLFQGTRFGAAGVGLSLSCMVILLVCENDQHGLNARAPSGVRLLTSNRRGGCKSWRLFMLRVSDARRGRGGGMVRRPASETLQRTKPRWGADGGGAGTMGIWPRRRERWGVGEAIDGKGGWLGDA